jgi:zinc transporter 1/2/3
LDKKKLKESEEAKGKENEHEHSHEVKKLSKTTVFILMLAFGIHELFEGIAFGLMTETAIAVQLAVGIVIHKTCAAVSLGAGFAKTGFSVLQIAIFISLFSLSTPIGIIIGLSITGEPTILTSIFFQLSAGTFIYVACTEIITHEFESPKWSGLKLLLTILGGVVIGALWFLSGEEHEHE